MSNNVVCFSTERQKRQPEIHEEIEDIVIFTTESGDEYEFTLDFDDALTPGDFRQPRVEETLFGWSCTIWNHYEEEWWTLPQFYTTEEAALAAGAIQEVALDFDFDML